MNNLKTDEIATQDAPTDFHDERLQRELHILENKKKRNIYQSIKSMNFLNDEEMAILGEVLLRINLDEAPMDEDDDSGMERETEEQLGEPVAGLDR